MSTAALDVRMYDRRVGRLTARSGTLGFEYDTDWRAQELPPLSVSLPVRTDPYVGEPVHSFFSNLLPEGEVRRHVARRFGVSVGNDFALLEAIGGDCAGAVSVAATDESRPARGPQQVRWYDEEELAQVVAELPSRPLLADPDDEIRLSLAGAQDKLPVVARAGRIGVPIDGAPSTHILKASISRFDDTVFNERFCLQLARDMGLNVASAHVRAVGTTEVLLVERYDRTVVDDLVERIHQEDLCQATGVPPEHKYQVEGGPGMAECVDVIRRSCTRPVRDVLAFADAVVFNFLIGNHDAHGKNFSLLHRREETVLAPLYDLVCTAAYPELSRKMAMKLGGEYRPQWVRRRHLERFAEEAGLGVAGLRNRALRMALAVPDVAHDVGVRLRESEGHRPVIDRAIDVVDGRARALEEELRTSERRGRDSNPR